jgi:hypothetical protein
MSKTISINPDLFKHTKKKRAPAAGIKPRAAATDRNKTVRRNQVLKFIRGEQEKNYRRLLDGDVNLKMSEEEDVDFQQSLDYLMSLAEKVPVPLPTRPANFTLKSQSSFGGGGDQDPYENVSLVVPDGMQPPVVALRPAVPQWGCLKGGKLPSYRQWTQKNRLQQPSPPPPQVPYTAPLYHPPSAAATLGIHSNGAVQDMLLRNSEIRQTMAAAEGAKPLQLARQQRTVRRTYNVGKNKSQVSVLVSNKTIRNRVTEKTHEIRQKPMEEVKRFLINKGFVRVGTSAPNDVLRKMYESAQLICGEIQNHNPENLLFNFMAV